MSGRTLTTNLAQWRGMMLGMAMVAGSCAVVSAQPVDGGPDGRPQQREQLREQLRDRMRDRMDERAPDAATLKQRLQKRLEENQKAAEHLRAAIEKLEKGGDIAEVMKDLEQTRPLRDGAREGGRDGMGEGPLGGPGQGQGGGPGGRGPDGGGPGGAGPGGNGPMMPLNAKEREELNRFVAKHMPKVAEKMKTFASLEPEAADRMTARMAPRIRELMGMEGREPKLFSHRVEEMRAGFEIISSSRDLSDLIRSKGAEKDIAAAEDRVRAAVRARVEAQMLGQEAEIESLAGRVESLRAQLKDRTGSKEDRIKEESGRVIERARDPENRGPRGRRDDKKPEPREGDSGKK